MAAKYALFSTTVLFYGNLINISFGGGVYSKFLLLKVRNFSQTIGVVDDIDGVVVIVVVVVVVVVIVVIVVRGGCGSGGGFNEERREILIE